MLMLRVLAVHLLNDAQLSSLATLPFAPINEPHRRIPSAVTLGGVLYLNLNLGISAIGTASFDYLHKNIQIKPRAVVNMDWFSEPAGDRHEYIVLKVSDKVNR